MPTVRPPPALQVFPTLLRFPALNPRRMQNVPVGCDAREVSRDDLRRGILHIYHDLGVLAFAGCSFKQIQKIGDVLSQVVTWGGPGGVVAMLDKHTIKYQREREDEAVVQGADLQEVIEKRRVGILKLETVHRLARARLREQLKVRVAGMKPAVKGVLSRETEVLIPGSPSPSGIFHHTVLGPRRLPIESWSSVTVDAASGVLFGEVSFFTVGSGEYLGAAQINYLLFRLNEQGDEHVPFWSHGRIPERQVREKQVTQERMDKVHFRVMMPLWDLERDIWLEKWEAFLEDKREEYRLSRKEFDLQKVRWQRMKEERELLQQEWEEQEREAKEWEAPQREAQEPEADGELEQGIEQNQDSDKGDEKELKQDVAVDQGQERGVSKSGNTGGNTGDANGRNDARRADGQN